MPEYNIDRSGSSALMPEDYQREIIQKTTEQSIIMQLAKRLPNMPRKERRIPVLSVLPTAYFTNPGPGDVGDTGYKKTSKQAWENKYLEAEELNVIIPIPEAVFNDVDYDMWEQIKPQLLEAFGRAFDLAVLYGINAPAAWPTNIVTAAQAAGNAVSISTNLYTDIMDENGLLAKVEEDGYMVNGHISAMTMRAKLRGLRDANGQPIFKSLYKEGVQGATRYEIDGEAIYFPRNGSIIPSRTLDICGDWDQLLYAFRQDVTYKIDSEGVIQDPDTGEIIYNLLQQNMIALRACMRIAWQVPNPINRLNNDEETRYPFAVLIPEGS
jgi:HK97 family phage major capsid protein